jgi:hypothetical protein
MLSRNHGWSAALAVTLATAGMITAEVDDIGFRRWWEAHPLTTDTVAGLFVLLITVLVADQVIRLRQVQNRSRATAAQAVIVMAQALRASQTVSAAVSGQGGRDEAVDEMRTYAMMLLVAAPVLIEAKAARDFLEESQRLGGEMARVMRALTSGKGTVSSTRMDDAARQVKAAAGPLLQPLQLDELLAAGVDDTTADSRVPDNTVPDNTGADADAKSEETAQESAGA